MARLHAATVPPWGLGLISLVLAFIGLAVIFLPILAIPISAVGLVAGLAGLGWASRRWSLAGIALSVLVLVLGSAIAAVPENAWAPRPLLTAGPTITTPSYVAPPARAHWWRTASASHAGGATGNSTKSDRE